MYTCTKWADGTVPLASQLGKKGATKWNSPFTSGTIAQIHRIKEVISRTIINYCQGITSSQPVSLNMPGQRLGLSKEHRYEKIVSAIHFSICNKLTEASLTDDSLWKWEMEHEIERLNVMIREDIIFLPRYNKSRPENWRPKLMHKYKQEKSLQFKNI